jgi:hypothetical protein
VPRPTASQNPTPSHASLIFTGLTLLPMTAGWDHLTPEWFTRLHARRGTPVRSILFVAALVMALILLSMLGVRVQEASQLLANASIAHYALAYVGLFALPLVGRGGGAGEAARVGEGGGAGGISIERGFVGDCGLSDCGCDQPDGVCG